MLSRLIVCEKSGQWALAWRKLLPTAPDGRNVRLVETRNLEECRQALRETPAAAVSFELRGDNLESTCEALFRWDDEFPAALRIVTAERSLADAEELVREAGANWFVTSPRRLRALLPVVGGHFALQPQPAASQRQRIWAELPWAGASMSGQMR